MNKIINVNFCGSTLYVVERNGEPYVPMKPVVEGMGLDWKAQHYKIKQRFASTMAEITMVAADGKNREMTCIPLRKLNGWLLSISKNKVSPEKKEVVEAYQEECDDVLYDYWTKGVAINSRFEIEDLVKHLALFMKESKQKGGEASLGMHQRKKDLKRIKKVESNLVDMINFSFDFGGDECED